MPLSFKLKGYKLKPLKALLYTEALQANMMKYTSVSVTEGLQPSSI